MDHIAIMNRSWKLIPKIISGEKSIESRWYMTRRSPWNWVSAGDRVFFKNSGEPVTACADVAGVMQFEMKDISEVKAVIDGYGDRICLIERDPRKWSSRPRYCVLMELERPREVAPFQIDKSGFGTGAAWISVKNISKIKKCLPKK